SYRSNLTYNGDRYGVVAEHMMVGGHFNPEIGFVRRSDFRRTFLQGRFSPRLQKQRAGIRRLIWQGSSDYITNEAASRAENRESLANFGLEFDSGDTWTIAGYTRDYEWLPRPFVISPGVVVPAGGYDYQTVNSSYTISQQRTVFSGTISFAYGG